VVGYLEQISKDQGLNATFSHDGKQLAVSSFTNEVRLFDLEVRMDDPVPDLTGGLPTSESVVGLVVNLLDGPDVEGQKQFTTERWIGAVVRAGAVRSTSCDRSLLQGLFAVPRQL
jgi:hypothetical protein